jgi:hypothetical protein
MSDIAKALANAAKITESGNLQRAHQKSAAAVRKNHTREFIWSGVLSCVGIIALSVLLVQPTEKNPPLEIRAPATTETPLWAAASPPPLANTAIEAQLANLVIKALIKTPHPRALIGDRFIEVGDEIIPGVILSGIEARELIATDQQGKTYRIKM